MSKTMTRDAIEHDDSINVLTSRPQQFDFKTYAVAFHGNAADQLAARALRSGFTTSYVDAEEPDADGQFEDVLTAYLTPEQRAESQKNLNSVWRKVIDTLPFGAAEDEEEAPDPTGEAMDRAREADEERRCWGDEE